VRHLLCILVALLVSAGARAGVGVTPDVDSADSAGLFVGVQRFQADDSIEQVKYAVDDAVDLAYALSETKLLMPKQIALALCGEPMKAISKAHLAELTREGASVHAATQSEIIRLLESQAEKVGKSGILVASFATHGVTDDGVQYLLTASSRLRDRETSLSEAKIRDIVYESGVERSLIFIDACRQKLTKGPRPPLGDPRSAAALLKSLAGVYGHVVYSAAAVGGYAYDDDETCNGVFTAAVIAALECGAKTVKGYVTVDTLNTFVEKRVLSWVRTHRQPRARKATQLLCEGQAKKMRLSVCARRAH